MMGEFDRSNDCDTVVRIKGTFMGQPIDVTIDDQYTVPEEPEQPEEPVRDLTSEVPDAIADAPSADPAPEVKEVSEEPKNPAGNAEQL